MTTAAAPVPATTRARPAVRWGDLLAAGIGFACALDVQVIGRLYLGELLLGALGLGIGLVWLQLPREQGRRWLPLLLGVFAVYLVTLVATDFYRGTAPRDYLRGWFRAALYIGDVLGLLVLGFVRPQRLMWWTGGFALSQLASLALTGGLTIANWKFGASLPVTLLALILVGNARASAVYPLLAALTVLHLALDYRSLAGFCLIVGFGIYVSRWRARHGGPLLSGPILTMGVIVAALFGGLYVANRSLLASGQELLERRSGSNIERLAGFVVGFDVVSRSPFVGYGSWPRNDEVFSEWASLQEELGSILTAEELTTSSEEKGEEGLIKTHSQLLQAWVEAGLVGAICFAVQLGFLLWLGWRSLSGTTAPALLPLCLFWVAWTGWAILFSPFSGIVRLFNGISIAIAVSAVLGGAPLARRPSPAGTAAHA